jgi:hypothetical protein
MRRLTPTQIAYIGAAALLLLLLAVLFVPRGNPDQDKLGHDQVAATAEDSPETRCGSQATYDLIKREIFRQAAETRGRDQSAFDRVATAATARMERGLFKSKDDDVGLIRCTGRLSIDLPPGLAVIGGRRTLSANLDYVVQPAADGTGDVVMLEGADAIVIPLATLATIGKTPPPVVNPATAPPIGNEVAPEPAPAPPPPVQVASPSFDCRLARTRGEIAVCRDPGLAALDRQMAAQYSRAMADPRAAELLRRTRDAFLRYRDQCPTDACIADAYRGRMREIQDIASGNCRPGQ